MISPVPVAGRRRISQQTICRLSWQRYENLEIIGATLAKISVEVKLLSCKTYKVLVFMVMGICGSEEVRNLS